MVKLLGNLKFIPSVYWEDRHNRRELIKWFVLGLSFRIILMPITVSRDLLGLYWRANQWVAGKSVCLETVKGAFIGYIHGFFLFLLKPIMPYLDAVLVNPTPDWTSCSAEMLKAFVAQPHIHGMLFLFKLPYLIFELACVLVLLAILKQDKKGLLAFKFWMLNPVILYGIYVLGKFESISLLFILLSLYYVKNEQLYKSLLSLGIGIATRFYALLYLPFYIIFLGKGVKEKLKLGLCGILPLGLLAAVQYFAGSDIRSSYPEYLSKIDYLFKARFYIGFDSMLYVFVIAYCLLIFYAYYFPKYTFQKLCESLFIVLLLLYSICYFSDHFLVWLMPFYALMVVKHGKQFIKLFVVLAVVAFIYTLRKGPESAGYLLAPVHPEYFLNLPSPASTIAAVFPIEKFISIFRSILSAICIWAIFLVLKYGEIGNQMRTDD